jgi:4-hydroxy-2-oxoheptanedioate aldolase
MISENFIKSKLQKKESVIGTWILIPSIELIDVITSTGIDFVILDFEHSALDFRTAQMAIIACERNKVSPIVRVSKISEDEILKFLDMGIHGIQVSHIETQSQAEELVKVTSFHNGTRGLSPFTRAGKFSKANLPEHIQTADKNILRSVILESHMALKNIDEILNVPEIDIFYIGLFDLSRDLGVPGQVNSPVVLDKLHELNDKIKAHGKVMGTISSSSEDIKLYKRMGINFIAHLSDTSMIFNQYSHDVAAFKKF